MKILTFFATIVVAGWLALPMQAAESDQLKSDLVGQCIGGREKCWRFQSVDQIKQLAIKNKTEDARKRVYTVTLQLKAANVNAKYEAEARIEYTKAGNNWKIKQVGLLSMKKME